MDVSPNVLRWELKWMDMLVAHAKWGLTLSYVLQCITALLGDLLGIYIYPVPEVK